MRYSDICEAKGKRQMRARFAVLLTEISAKFGGSPRSHESIQLNNVGYFAGYYDHATRARVQKWLNAVHPIFGRTFPSAKQAFEAGKRIGRKAAKQPLRSATK